MAGNNPEWTSEQMIENASNWSLAGDVALLNSLKKFSEGLLSQTVSISANVDNLLNNLESVSLKLDLTKNEFQSLRNTQFIENRVYEDDETIANNENKKEEKELTEEEKENIIRESILKGLKVMKNYFEKVEVSVSDSEEDVQEKSYILQPKDLYADRPLPYLVGSKEWYKSWHVGLLPSESESESEKEEEVYSSSDPEEMLPKDKILGSETSSELDFTNRNTGPVANSTFNDTQDRGRETFHSSDESSEQNSSLSAQVSMSSESFADQLAAKLGNVIDKTNDNLEHVNIKKLQQPTKYGNLFSDEPPPLDEDLDETVLPKSAHEGLFSGGRDLFIDSHEEDLFFGQPKTSTQNEYKPEQKEAHPPVSKPKSMVSKGLFDNSESSSEDEMFMAAEKRQVKVAQPFLQPFKPTIPFIDDRPPEITSKSESEPSKKKPIGGVSIFGEKTDLFGDSTGKPGFESSKTAINSEKSQESPKKSFIIKKSLKKTSLFDESSSENEETPKGKDISTKEPGKVQTSKHLSLFDDSEDDNTPKAQNTPNIADKKKKVSLFDDDGLPAKKEENSELPVKDKKINLFSEDPYQNIDLFKPTAKEITEKNESLKKSSIENNKPAKKISLFDDDDDFFKEEDDIFASVPKKKNIFEDFGVGSTSKSSKSLFEDIEESDTSSKAPVSKDIQPKKSSLFDDLESSQSSESFIGSSTYEDNVIKEVESSKKTLGKEPKKDLSERIFDDLLDSDNSNGFLPNNLVKSKETDPKHGDKKGILKDSLFEDTEIPKKKTDSTKSGEKDESFVTKDLNQEKAVKSLFEDLESSVEEENVFKRNDIEEPKTEEILKSPVEDVTPIDEKVILFEDKDADDISVNNLKEGFSDVNKVRKTKDHEPLEDTKATEIPKYEDQDQKNQYTESKNVLQPNTLGKVRKSVGFLDSDSSSDESFLKINEDKNTQEEKSLFIDNKPEETKTKQLSDASQSTDGIPECLPEEHTNKLDKRDSKNYAIPPPIDLFDPTPPPPDPNWDAGSDNSGSSDTFSLTDGILDRTTFNQSQVRSSLFDEAPPSLDVNESSGIVRDLNATRVETDDSSFYPYASSSRRFSSDLFSEQQSQDSFFVTKNKTEPGGQSGPNLGNIPEKSENVSSLISNLTPSGNVEDFEDSSVFGEKSSEAESMSKASNLGEKPQVAKRVSLFEKKIDGDNVKKSSSFFEEKSAVDKENCDADKSGNSPVKASPGKLKHSLSINVGALLPGARPMLRPSIAKSISLDETDESAAPTLRLGGAAADTPPVNRVAKSRSEIFSGKETATGQSGDDQKFDNVDQTEVLASATKDRVRIPVKRRPSTRKARQEAVRKSVTDFSIYKTEEISSENEPNDRQPAHNDKDSSLKDIHDELGAPKDGLKTETSGPDARETKKEDINDKLGASEDGLKKETSGRDARETKKEDINDKLGASEDGLKKETSGRDARETKKEDINDKLGAFEDGFKKETSGRDASKTKKEDLNNKLGISKDGLNTERSGPDARETKKEDINDKLGAFEDGFKKETSGPDASKPKKDDSNDKLGVSEDGLKTETARLNASKTKKEDLNNKLGVSGDGLRTETSGPDAIKTKNEDLNNKLGVSEDGLKKETSGSDASRTKKEEEPVPRGISLVFGKTSTEQRAEKNLAVSLKEEKIDDMFKPHYKGPISDQQGLESGNSLPSALKHPESLEREKFTTEPKSIFEESFEDQSEIFKTKNSGGTSIGKLPKGDSSLFGGTDSDSSDENLFGGATYSTKKDTNKPKKIEPISTKNEDKKSSIFSDKSDDGEEDLFGGKSRGSEKKKLGATSKKSSIFDDSGDSDDDDLFGAKTSKSRGSGGDADDSKGSIGVRSVQNKNNKSSSLKKVENKEVTDFDPLSALFK